VKVTPVDVHEGLRVLESGLEPGQKVIVEGIQLVRQDQVVEPQDAPLERYIRTETDLIGADRRYTSRISRIPGMEPPGSPTQPPPPSTTTTRPAADTKANDKADPRSAPAPETKAR